MKKKFIAVLLGVSVLLSQGIPSFTYSDRTGINKKNVPETSPYNYTHDASGQRSAFRSAAQGLSADDDDISEKKSYSDNFLFTDEDGNISYRTSGGETVLFSYLGHSAHEKISGSGEYLYDITGSGSVFTVISESKGTADSRSRESIKNSPSDIGEYPAADGSSTGTGEKPAAGGSSSISCRRSALAGSSRNLKTLSGHPSSSDIPDACSPKYLSSVSASFSNTQAASSSYSEAEVSSEAALEKETRYVFMASSAEHGFDEMYGDFAGTEKQIFYLRIRKLVEETLVSRTDFENVKLTGDNGSSFSGIYYGKLRYSDLGLDISEAIRAYSYFCLDTPMFYFYDEYSYDDSYLYFFADSGYASHKVRSDLNLLITQELNNTRDYVFSDPLTFRSNYAVIKYIHDKIIRRVNYNFNFDEPSYTMHRITGYFNDYFGQKRMVVCDGYSYIFSLFMNFIGISCETTGGVSASRENFENKGEDGGHAWNIVQAGNGTYYYMDVTWDDNISDQTYDDPSSISYAYFLKGSKSFDLNHYTPHSVSDRNNLSLPASLSATDWTGSGDNDTLLFEDDPSYIIKSSLRTPDPGTESSPEPSADVPAINTSVPSGSASAPASHSGAETSSAPVSRPAAETSPSAASRPGAGASPSPASGSCSSDPESSGSSSPASGSGVPSSIPGSETTPDQYTSKTATHASVTVKGNTLIVTGSGILFTSDTLAGNPWYKYKDTVTQIIINEGVTVIGGSAFRNFSSLRNIIFPETLQTVGSSAFRNCDSLVSVSLPDNVTCIGTYSFADCDSLESFSVGAMAGASSPEFDARIGNNFTADCPKFKVLTVSSENNAYKAEDNVLFTKDMSILIMYISSKMDKEYIVPEEVTTIGTLAFDGNKYLEKITFCDGITTYGDEAFRSCSSLKTVIFGDPGTEKVNYSRSFFYASGVNKVTVPENASYFSSNNGVLLGKDGTLLLFYPNGLTSEQYTTPSSVTEICTFAFCATPGLKKLTCSANVKTIDMEAFFYMYDLRDLIIGRNTTSFSAAAIWGSDNITKITNRSSLDISLHQYGYRDIDGVSGYYNWKNISTGKYIDTIKSGTAELTAIGTFQDKGSVFTVNGITFKVLSYGSLIENKYKTDNNPENWKFTPDELNDNGLYAGRVLLFDMDDTAGLTYDAADTVEYNGWEYDVTQNMIIHFSSNTLRIMGCGDITLNTLNPYTSYYRENTEKIIIYDTISSVGNNSFISFSKVRSISLGKVRSIGFSALSYMRSLKSIVIPDTVTGLSDNILNGTDSLQLVTNNSGLPVKLYNDYPDGSKIWNKLDGDMEENITDISTGTAIASLYICKTDTAAPVSPEASGSAVPPEISAVPSVSESPAVPESSVTPPSSGTPASYPEISSAPSAPAGSASPKTSAVPSVSESPAVPESSVTPPSSGTPASYPETSSAPSAPAESASPKTSAVPSAPAGSVSPDAPAASSDSPDHINTGGNDAVPSGPAVTGIASGSGSSRSGVSDTENTGSGPVSGNEAAADGKMNTPADSSSHADSLSENLPAASDTGTESQILTSGADSAHIQDEASGRRKNDPASALSLISASENNDITVNLEKKNVYSPDYKIIINSVNRISVIRLNGRKIKLPGSKKKNIKIRFKIKKYRRFLKKPKKLNTLIIRDTAGGRLKIRFYVR